MIRDLDLDEILVRDDIQATWSNLKNAFLNTMESCIPKAVLPMRHNLPWLNKEIVQLITESVDSVCRDTTYTQYMVIQKNLSKSQKRYTYKPL